MRKHFVTAVGAIAALGILCQSANADEILDFILGHNPKVDRRVEAAGLGVGIGTTVGYLAITDFRFNQNLGDATQVSGLNVAGATVLTTAACTALSPIIATLVVDRPLTYREANTLIFGCIIPFIGPYLVNYWFDTHPDQDPDRLAEIKQERQQERRPVRRARHARR